MTNLVDIGGVKVANICYKEIQEAITDAISGKQRLIITYANANTVNLCHNSDEFRNLLNTSFLTHPDGVGIYFASKFLYGNRGLKMRISGSDLYPKLTRLLTKNGTRTFFFGHTNEMLLKVKSFCPELNISGYCEGFNFESLKLVNEINSADTEILIIGLGQPLQERWIHENADKLNVPAIIAVGDGIKVFAGEKKRGPLFMQKMGLEWLVRLVTNPAKYFKRYVTGIPIFLCRIIWIKLSNL